MIETKKSAGRPAWVQVAFSKLFTDLCVRTPREECWRSDGQKLPGKGPACSVSGCSPTEQSLYSQQGRQPHQQRGDWGFFCLFTVAPTGAGAGPWPGAAASWPSLDPCTWSSCTSLSSLATRSSQKRQVFSLLPPPPNGSSLFSPLSRSPISRGASGHR